MNQSLVNIHPDAIIAPDVKIGPFTTIANNVEIGKGTVIDSNVTICEGVRIGENCRIFPGAVVGAVPQDLKFRGEETLVVIGNNTTLREYVTVHRGTAARGKTRIGDNCLIMAYCHVAHDCIIGNNVIMSNMTQLAGEVEIDDYAILSGGILVHQFTQIGAHVMIQGGSRITKDVPPYVTAGREPLSYAGINSVGLRRRGYTEEQINAIHNAYRFIYQSGLNTAQAIEKIEKELPASPELDTVLTFIKKSERGIIKGYCG